MTGKKAGKTRARATPGKGRHRATAPPGRPKLPEICDESVFFLWRCLHNNGGNKLDYSALASDLGISRNAAYKRFNKLKALCEEAERSRARNSAPESGAEPQGLTEALVEQQQQQEEEEEEEETEGI